MNDMTTPASAGAQPVADANSIDSIIDNAVTEATQEAPEAEQGESEEAASQSHEDQFPKKAVNAISRRDKQIGKLRAQYEAAQAELAKFREQPSQQQPAKNDGEPKETDYANYHEYLRALNKYDNEQLFKARDSKQQETQQSAQEQQWVAQREHAISAQAQDIAKKNPEIAATIEEHVDIFDDFSPALQKLFYEAENPVMATYHLAKEGKLESLTSMSLARAAMEIGRAQTQAYAKPQTKAPAPLPAARGSVASKSLNQMSGSELLKALNL